MVSCDKAGDVRRASETTNTILMRMCHDLRSSSQRLLLIGSAAAVKRGTPPAVASAIAISSGLFAPDGRGDAAALGCRATAKQARGVEEPANRYALLEAQKQAASATTAASDDARRRDAS